MENFVTRFLAEYIENNNLSALEISKELQIPKEKLFLGTRECLTAEELLKLCRYLGVRPEEIVGGER